MNANNQKAFELARRYSSDKIIAKAYAEYTANISEKWLEVLDLFNTACDEESTSDEISGKMKDYNINPYQYFFLNKQEVNINDLLLDIHYSVLNDTDNSDPNTPLISMKEIEYAYNTVEDILSEINATYHAITVEYAISSAYDLADNITNKISIARDTIHQRFNSAFTDISGSLEYAIQNMKSCENISDYIKQQLINSGIQEAANSTDNDNEAILSFNNSNSYQFSGATPASAYCWNTVGNAIVSGVKVAATATVNILGGILNIGKRLFKKGVKALNRLVVDPYDIEKLDVTLPNHTVDGYAHNFIYESYITQETMTALASIKNLKNWYHVDFFCSEHMVRVKDIDRKFSSNHSSFNNTLMENVSRFLDLPENDPSDIMSIINWFYKSAGGKGEYTGSIQDFLLFIPTIKFDAGFTMNDVYNTKEIHSYINNVMLPSYKSIINSFPEKFTNDIIRININNVYDCTNIPLQDWMVLNDYILSMVLYIEQVNRYKPVSVSFKSLLGSPTSNVFNSSDVIRCFDAIVNDANPYVDTSISEVELYNGFVFGRLCYELLLKLLNAEVRSYISGVVTPAWISDPTYNYISIAVDSSYTINGGNTIDVKYNKAPFKKILDSYTVEEIPSLDSIGNANQPAINCDAFIFISSGNITNTFFFNAVVGNYSNISGYDQNTINALANHKSDFSSLSEIIHQILYVKYKHPLDYPFWPYSKENVSWFNPEFRIKTDQQNIDAFNKFITTAVIVTFLVLAAGGTIIALKRKRLDAFAKQQGDLWKMSEKAANGTLSDEDIISYKKSTKKLNRLEKLTGNLNTPKTTSENPLQTFFKDSSSTIDNNNVLINDVVKLIMG